MNPRTIVVTGLCAILCGCTEPLQLAHDPNTTALGVGEERAVTLRFLRFDVENFERSLTLTDLQKLPRRALENTWLFDLPVQPLVTNALERFAATPEKDTRVLSLASRNMFYLLNMTPLDARLDGTSLAELATIGDAVGISSARILADLLKIEPDKRIVPMQIVANVVVDQVISSHPHVHVRNGHHDAAAGTIAITLEDFATDFASLAHRFGPAPMQPNFGKSLNHPGFLASIVGLGARAQAFRMTIRVNVNALPFKGIDAQNGAEASVNSMGMQLMTAFDFRDPNWLTITGLEENLTLSEMVMILDESDEYIPGGTNRAPLPIGDSPVWSEPSWVTERVLAEVGRRIAMQIPAHCTTYSPSGRARPPFEAVRVCIDSDGWVDIRIDPSVVLHSQTPAPSYLWDLLLEVAQARMHDGGLLEGEADVILPVHNVPIGLPTADIVDRIRTNLQNDPQSFRGVAEALTDNTFGDADVYYVQPHESLDDWLFFVAPDDIRKDEVGNPVRAYSYRNPGFFADSDCTEKVSSHADVDGDTTHEKVQIHVGDVLYIEDALGHRYRLVVHDKPSGHKVVIIVNRIS